ncbi:MAG: glycosyltransferase [Candidatus Omnitrophica bacterium]|nr:glycosyltransferase [Candidatus Omnitrophota bacterium]
MKVLQVLPEMNVGGVERGTLDLARYLVEHGHESVVVSQGGTLVPQLEAEGTKHIQLPVHQKNIFTAWHCVKELERIIRAEKADIVHARSRVPAWIAYFAARRTDAEFVTTCHGYYANHWLSHPMGWGKRVIAISDVIGRHMIEDFKVHAENVRLIHRSVDLDTFQYRPRKSGRSPYVVTMIGRITPLKGHEYFLKAMAKVIRKMPYVRVRIIGDAPSNKQAYKDNLVLLTKRLGIVDQVEFMGNCSDIPQKLSETDVLVLATVTQEAFGRVLIEAQAVGVPVVATKVGGVVDIVEHEKTGLLVLPKDPDDIAQAVTRLLTDLKLVDAMTAEARARVEQRYTLEQMASKTLKVYEEVRKSVNILVIKLSAVGDIILATASLKALRDRFPDARICCLSGREGATVLHGCPYIDDVVVYDYRVKDKGFFGFWRILSKLRRYRFDKVIDFQNNNRSHLMGFLCLPRASYGYKNQKLGFLLTDGIPDDDPNIQPVRHQFRVLEKLGIEYSDAVRLKITLRPDDHEYARELLHGSWIDEKAHTIVGINIAASEKWASKNWPVENIAALCDMLAADNIRVIITGMEKDNVFVRNLAAVMKSKPSVFVGKTTLMQLAALISYCKVYITPDSAPLHVAASVGVPVISLFGPTNPERHVPPGETIRVMRKTMPCVPCYKAECKSKNGPTCMRDITPYEVYLEVMRLLGREVKT